MTVAKVLLWGVGGQKTVENALRNFSMAPTVNYQNRVPKYAYYPITNNICTHTYSKNFIKFMVC